MTTYDLRTLARLLNVEPRTIFRYTTDGLLPKRLGHNRYGDEHLVRGLLARRWMMLERLNLQEAKARLKGRSLAELRAELEPSSSAQPSTNVGTAPRGDLRGVALPASKRWERAILVPGLELSIVSDAGPLLRRLATEILTLYSAAARKSADEDSAASPSAE